MTKIYHVYLDEAGDEGFGKLHTPKTVGGGQSRWLAIGGIILAENNNRKTAIWRDDILSNFAHRKRRDIHWKDFKHEQKVRICQDISELPVGIGVVMSNKQTIPGSKYEARFSKKGYLYNYLVRWSLERFLTAVHLQEGTDDYLLKVNFSRRAGTDYQHMKNYLIMLRDGDDVVKSPRKTDWSKLDIEGTRVENHSKSPGLQLADCVVSAFFNGFESNLYGNTEPRYAQVLSGKLLQSRINPIGEGIALVPNIAKSQCTEEHMALLNSLRRSERTPGS